MPPEINVIKEIVKANAMAVYQDAAQPSLRVVGKTLAQCVSLFTTPIGRMAGIFEKNLHRYIDKLEGLEEKDLVTPDIRILVPVLEKMRFTDEEKVADYYAEILATASKKEHASKVMVTFIEILNRLTADEINILEYINSEENKIPLSGFTEEEFKKYGLSTEIKELVLSKSLPVIDINVTNEGLNGYIKLVKNFNCLKENILLTAPENIDLYIDNMISLGLLERTLGEKFATEKIYDHLEKHKEVVGIRSKLLSNQRLELRKGKINTTDLGIKLLALCSHKNKIKNS